MTAAEAEDVLLAALQAGLVLWLDDEAKLRMDGPPELRDQWREQLRAVARMGWHRQVLVPWASCICAQSEFRVDRGPHQCRCGRWHAIPARAGRGVQP